MHHVYCNTDRQQGECSCSKTGGDYKENDRERSSGIRAEIITMKTTGDKILDKSLEKIEGKGCSSKSLTVRLRRAGSTLPYTA